MSDSEHAHELPKDPHSVTDADVIFECPSCHKSLVVEKQAVGHNLHCPLCHHSIVVPEQHRVVTLDEAPETKQLHSKPAWEQELVSVESALKETNHQREEAGNFYKHHVSEANRQKLRIEKLDAKLKELEARRKAVRVEHPH